MKEVLVLKELEQIKAISQEYRLQIVEAFEHTPKTAKQIAKWMDEPHGRVNYHIKMLEKVGIVELVEEITKFGVVEKYYCPVAKKMIIDSTAVTLDDEMNQSIGKVSLAFFEGISRDFYDSLENYNGAMRRKIAYAFDYYLTEEEAKELSDKLSHIMDSFLLGKDKPRENAQRHFLAHMVMPMPDRDEM
jgi:DNA-binding transcriptional ArsR family regulator